MYDAGYYLSSFLEYNFSKKKNDCYINDRCEYVEGKREKKNITFCLWFNFLHFIIHIFSELAPKILKLNFNLLWTINTT